MEEAVKDHGGWLATPFTPFGSVPAIRYYSGMAAGTGNRPLHLYYYGVVQGCSILLVSRPHIQQNRGGREVIIDYLLCQQTSE